MVVFAGLASGPARAAPGDAEAVGEVLGAWDLLTRSVKVGRVTSTQEGAVTVRSAKGDVFGVKGELELRSRGVDPFQLKLSFPRGRGPTAQALTELLGTDPASLIPDVLRGGFKLDHVAIELAQKKPVAVSMVARLDDWKPFGAQGLIVKGFASTLTLFEPLGKRHLEARLSGTTRLPAGLAKYLALEALDLAVSGLVDTESKTFMLTVALSPTPLPIGGAPAVSLDGAHLRLGFDRGVPTVAIGGALGVRPAAGSPLNLRAELALKLSGEVYLEAWNDGVWSNPFGASPRLHVLSPGLGLGADFTAVPWPMPIMSIQGGLAVGADPARPEFMGSVVAGVHGGDPTQNVLDAEFSGTDLARMLAGVGVTGLQGAVAEVLSAIELRAGRLTVVPPGPGVRLFGEFYPPGFLIEADLRLDTFSGRLFADVAPTGTEVAAAMTPVAFPGFSLTGVGPEPGPSLYFLSKQGTVALAITGTLELLGLKRSVDVHMSPGGFSASLSGSVFGAAQASLEVAGRNPFKQGGLWVRAEMAQDFGEFLKRDVTARIDADLKAQRTSFGQARADLERHRASLIAADKRLNEARDAKVAELKRSCEAFRIDDRKRADKQAERDALDRRIAGHDQRVRELEATIAAAEQYAKRTRSTLNPLDCARGEVWDPIKGGGCYACPSGTNRDVAVHIEKRGACIRPILAEQTELAREKAAAVTARADRDIVQRALALLASGIDKAGQEACKVAADATAIDRLPGVKELVGEHRGITTLIDAAQGILTGAEFATVTTAGTAKWLAERGGDVAGILEVKAASFEGCVDTVHAGTVSMNLDAVFAGRPVQGSFRLDLRKPADGLRALATSLLKKAALMPAARDGNCQRPEVPRVAEGSVVIPDRVTAMRKRQKPPGRKASAEAAPAWAKTGGSARERAAKKPETVKVPQVDPAEMCRRAVQGRIARDDAGRMAWSDPDLDALCLGTSNGSAPGTCYAKLFEVRAQLLAGVADPPGAILRYCGGVHDAEKELACLGRTLQAGGGVTDAMEACRARR